MMVYLRELNEMVCPLGIGGHNISFQNNIIGKACIGPKCMAWKWYEEPIYDEETEELIDSHPSDDLGYCGFIGE